MVKNADQKHRCHAICACKREEFIRVIYKARKNKIMGDSFFKMGGFSFSFYLCGQ